MIVYSIIQRIPILLLIISLCIIGCSSATEEIAIPIADSVVITEPGSYYLAGDILDRDCMDCIHIACSDVILDGRGYRITGIGQTGSRGVIVSDPNDADLVNITLSNLSISGFAIGINYESINVGAITNTIVSENAVGINLDNTRNIVVTHNNASGQVPGILPMFNGGGISLTHCSQNSLMNNTANQNGIGGEGEFGGYGFFSSESANNTYSGNIALNNERSGMEFYPACKNNLISENTVGGNIDGIVIGIPLFGENDNNEIIGNRITDNREAGILIFESTGNYLRSNRMEGNKYNFMVSGQEEIPEHYLHDIDRSNTVDGKPVYYLIGLNGGDIGPADNPGTIYAIDCSDLRVHDLTLSNNGIGAFFRSGTGNTLENVICNQNQYGSMLIGGTQSFLFDHVHLDTNSVMGLSLSDGINLTIQNSTLNGNWQSGIFIQDSSITIIRNSHIEKTGSPKGSGAQFMNCQDIIIDSTSISYNSNNGLEFDEANEILIQDGEFTGNAGLGIIAWKGDGVRISGMRIAGNGWAGCGIVNLTDSMIYDNYFYNIQNLDIDQDGTAEIAWNTARTAGPNIIGGPFIGGNYWATPNGTGWSQITPDRGDGFCIEPYEMNDQNTDFLPLVCSYEFVRTWGTRGVAEGEFEYPMGIAVDLLGQIHVADYHNHRIQIFDRSGTCIDTWGEEGSGDGQFQHPAGIGVDSDSNIYVADTGNSRIQKYDREGHFLTQWGGEGNGTGQFRQPEAIALDRTGTIYVADTANHRIQTFDSTGTFITEWGGEGDGDGLFRGPAGIGVDSAGNVYVADTDNHRIQKFDSTGSFILKWGSLGGGDGEFYLPHGIGIDAGGYIYVAGYRTHNIQKFDTDGNFITRWGETGDSDGEFHFPTNIAIDTAGYAYVSDTMNNRIQTFRPTSPVPIANFTAVNTIGTKPLTVQFTDESRKDPSTWLWDFGDGTGSTDQNPEKTYTNAGRYTIFLRATNTDGSDTIEKPGYITVTDPSSDGPADSSSSLPSAHIRGKGGTFTFEGLPIESIDIETGADLSFAIMTVERQQRLPESLSPPAQDVYQYFSITARNIAETAIEGAIIRFHISSGYLSSIGMTPADVILLHNQNGEWVSLKTTLIRSEEGKMAYYKAEAPGFSIFAIVLDKDGAEIASTIETIPTMIEEEGVSEREMTERPIETPTTTPVSIPVPTQTPVIYAPVMFGMLGIAAVLIRRGQG
jgi:PGF-pre-PGF domain-containing protein